MNRFLQFLILLLLPESGELLAEDFDDPRILGIVDRIEALESSGEKGVKVRTQKYTEDLKLLERKIQTSGDLDKVLEITEERQAWQEGRETPRIDPKDNSIHLDLRKLRYYFDRDVNLIRLKYQDISGDLNAAINVDLFTLERALTTEGKIEEAIHVRKMKEKFFATGSLSGSGKRKPSARSEEVAEKEPLPVSTYKPKSWRGDTWINKNRDYRPDNPLNPPRGSVGIEDNKVKTKSTIPVKIEFDNLPHGHEWALFSSNRGGFREMCSGFDYRRPPKEISISLYPFDSPYTFYLLAMTRDNWYAAVELRARFDRERSRGDISDEIRELRSIETLKKQGNLLLGETEFRVVR